MAKFFDTKKREVYWSDNDIYAPLEDAYFELSDFIALKKLDGHDAYDQWYMLVELKMAELIDALNNSPMIDRPDFETDKEIL